jgi:streptogramin lyase
VSGCIPGLRPGRLAHDLLTLSSTSARRRGRLASAAVLALGACLLAFTAAPVPGRAAPIRADVQRYGVPTPDAGLSDIVAGPDGSLWFNEQNGFSVGRITTAGGVTEFPVPRASYSADGDGPTAIVSSGGALWTLANVGSTIDAVSSTGAVTQLYAKLDQSATNLAPDSADGVWAASLTGAGGGPVSGGLFRVDPPKGRIRNYQTARFGGQYQPLPLIAGPDGTAWFPDGGTAIKRITNAGKILTVPIHGSGSMLVTSMAFDRQGNLWFTEYVPGGGFDPSTKGAIGEIAAGTTTATLTRLSGDQTPGSMILGPDGGIWFTWAKGIARLATTTGAVQKVRLGGAYHPSSIAFGRDRALWFVDPVANDIGRVAVAELPIGTHTPRPRPVVRFTGGSLARAAADRRLTFSCRLSAAAQCAVTAKLSAATVRRLKLGPRGARSAITLGTATRTLRRRGTAKLTIHLGSSVAAAFARHTVAKVPVALTATATIVTGRSATAQRTITLRR